MEGSKDTMSGAGWGWVGEVQASVLRWETYEHRGREGRGERALGGCPRGERRVRFVRA